MNSGPKNRPGPAEKPASDDDTDDHTDETLEATARPAQLDDPDRRPATATPSIRS